MYVSNVESWQNGNQLPMVQQRVIFLFLLKQNKETYVITGFSEACLNVLPYCYKNANAELKTPLPCWDGNGVICDALL